MRQIPMRLLGAFVAFALVALTLFPPAAAAGDCENGVKCWTFRGLVGRVDADADIYRTETFPQGGGEHWKYLISGGEAYAIGAEYLFNRRVGIDLGLGKSNFDALAEYDVFDIWEMDHDDLSPTTFSVASNFHLMPDAKADFYVGPMLGFYNFDTSTHRILGEFVDERFDDEVGLGVQAGLDYPIANAWALSALARFMPLSADGSGFVTGGLDIDPLHFLVGLAYSPRFGFRGRQPEPEVAPPPPPPPPPPPAAAPAPVAAPAPAPAPAPPPAPVVKPERRETINFDSGKSRVSNIGKAKLDEIGLSMVQDLSLTAHVVGHADSRGSDATNLSYSKSRAEAVKKYLVDRYDIDPSRITTEGVGSSQPVASNDSDAGRAQNRRAEIVVKQR